MQKNRTRKRNIIEVKKRCAMLVFGKCSIPCEFQKKYKYKPYIHYLISHLSIHFCINFQHWKIQTSNMKKMHPKNVDNCNEFYLRTIILFHVCLFCRNVFISVLFMNSFQSEKTFTNNVRRNNPRAIENCPPYWSLENAVKTRKTDNFVTSLKRGTWCWSETS